MASHRQLGPPLTGHTDAAHSVAFSPDGRTASWRLALDSDANVCSMPRYSFSLSEHDPERPWIVLRQEQHTVDLDESVNFYTWARAAWPADRYTVQLDPWQLSPSKPAEAYGSGSLSVPT